jgi:hypothetical protein
LKEVIERLYLFLGTLLAENPKDSTQVHAPRVAGRFRVIAPSKLLAGLDHCSLICQE